ncbi:MAG: transposase [Terriglobia bacterium]
MREYTYAFAALSPHDGTLDTLVLPEVDSFATSVFMAEVARRHPQEDIPMVLDGVGWRRAKDLRIPENMRLLPLPHYRPEWSPAERLWEEIREKWFPNLAFDSLAGVENRLVEALAASENNFHHVAPTNGFN